MRRAKGISGFVATLVLVVISLSLSYVVYEGVSRLAPPRAVVFSNQVLTLGGSPEIVEGFLCRFRVGDVVPDLVVDG